MFNKERTNVYNEHRGGQIFVTGELKENVDKDQAHHLEHCDFHRNIDIFNSIPAFNCFSTVDMLSNSQLQYHVRRIPYQILGSKHKSTVWHHILLDPEKRPNLITRKLMATAFWDRE
ncbi:hypothetical protein Trydic_g7972 [Trypoxylus dichotomus]